MARAALRIPIRAALQAAGFAERDLRVYTSQQILDDHQRYVAQRSLARQVVTAVTVDPDSLERYLDRAREGRAALWIHVPRTPTGSCATAVVSLPTVRSGP